MPIVDLSIIRALSRLAGIEPPGDIRRAPAVWDIAETLLPDKEVKEHNYGLLDFAADICKARLPRCDECPVAPSCGHAKHLARIGGQDITLSDLLTGAFAGIMPLQNISAIQTWLKTADSPRGESYSERAV